MTTSKGHKIVIIGCGNVAWQIAKYLKTLSHISVEVCNHKANPSLNEFKSKLKCSIKIGLNQVIADADYYFLCVSDKAISTVAGRLNIKNPNAILLHTSGSIKRSELGERVNGTGVFYPLQTFSKIDQINWKEIPIIIEGNSKETEQNILMFAKKFSNVVKVLPYKSRLRLHLAAVVVNNFVNALYVEAKQFLEKESKKMSFDLLRPLIEKTTGKLKVMTPFDAQTGPAKRNDLQVIEKHLKILSGHKEFKTIYKQLSKLIVDQQK
ncbi:MAG: DUF2520 domain-containing protein [bacterium]|nr:DUF2520 domain-containing protein [bacterium]